MMIRLNVFIQVEESNRNEVIEVAKELVAQSLKDNQLRLRQRHRSAAAVSRGPGPGEGHLLLYQQPRRLDL